MARNWTPSQQAAMSTHGRTLLISAAAGSGKTATLTERIIRRLTDPTKPADLSRLLIVTFTRAAASELRERISSALSDAIARDPGNHHLQKQLIGLSGAHISTIDAFVREPVKAHFAELGLPAATRIADEAELAPLRQRVMEEIIENFYRKYAGARSGDAFSLLDMNPFADLIDSLTPSNNDTELIPMLLGLYERLLAFPAELGRLKDEAERLESAAVHDFFESDHGAVIADWMRELCHSGMVTLEAALSDIRVHEAAAKAYRSAFESDLSFLSALSSASTYREAYALLDGYQNLRLGPLRNADPIFLSHKEARTAIVDGIKDLRKSYFTNPPEELTHQMRETATLCRVLHDLLTAYDTRILSEKQARGICDFTDNRRYLLSLMRGKDGAPSAFAADFRAQFDEVYIDEYQDVDELQDEIFRLVGGDHRFMVGDIKQSIYGFRGADPSVFARYRRTLPPLAINPEGTLNPVNAGETSGCSIFMSENFRCDESVIRVTNAVCGHIFRACPDSVAYTPSDDLGFAKLPPREGYMAAPVEVTVLTKPPKTDDAPVLDRDDGGELSGVETEATYVANRIASLLRSGDRLAGGEPIRPKDIVILMRNRSALSAYLEALTAMGIPTGSEELDAIEAGRDLLHGGDMMYLLNLLRVLDDPDQDIALSEILRAPFPGLDLEEVLSLRRVHDRRALSCSLYACVEDYATVDGADPHLSKKLADFMAWIEHYRALTATRPADAILRLLRRDDHCACRDTEAFLYLYDCARHYKCGGFTSLYAFLRYFEKKLLSSNTITPERRDEDGIGHVSIMTIHKSKGLEFPVCFVVRCGQYFSAASVSKDLIFEKRAGVAMKLYRRIDADGRPDGRKVDTTLRAAAALSTRLLEREEEMRVLYVAMTRARERLYLVGLGSEKPVTFSAGDRFSTLTCNTYLKWIQSGLQAHPEVDSYTTLTYIPTDRIVPDARLSPIAEGISMDGKADPIAERYRALVEDVRPLSPLEILSRRVPTKVAASRMKPLLLDNCIFYDTDVTDPDTIKLPEDPTGDTRCDTQSIGSIRDSLRLLLGDHGDEPDEFELLLRENRRPTPAEKGTAAHLFLQYCDYDRVMSRTCPLSDALEDEISRLFSSGFLNTRSAEILDRDMLKAFFESRFFAHIREATHIERELKFHRFLPLSSLTAHEELAKALAERTLSVQGSIDILARFADGHVEICDYKTDRITKEERTDPALLSAHMSERHGDQLRQYAEAVRELYGVIPSRIYIFSLPLGEAVEIVI